MVSSIPPFHSPATMTPCLKDSLVTESYSKAHGTHYSVDYIDRIVAQSPSGIRSPEDRKCNEF